MNERKIDYFVIAAPFLLFLAGLFLINPIAEFPLNDDWSFAKTIKNYTDTGELKICGWTSMTVIAQIIWGVLWVKSFGFSFTILRISTLLVGLAGVVYFMIYLYRHSKDHRLVSLFGITLLFSPLYFSLMYGFMTDVPFTVVMMISCFFFCRFIDEGGAFFYCVAIVFSVIGILIRQFAMVVPLAFLVAYAIHRDISFVRITMASLPSIVVFSVLKLYNVWFFLTQDTYGLYGVKEMEVITIITTKPFSFAKHLIGFSLISLYSIGLYLFPVALLYLQLFYRDKRKMTVFVASLLLLLTIPILVNLVKDNFPFGLVDKLMNDYGLGAYVLMDEESYFGRLASNHTLYWQILTVFASIGLAAFLVACLQLFDNEKQRTRSFFLLGCLVLYLGLSSASHFFDRYIVPMLPISMFIVYLCIVDINVEKAKVNYLVPFVFCVLLVSYSTVATCHFFTWNRTRWVALDWLMQEKNAKPEQIDGGFEFNGWYGYSNSYRQQENKSWYWVKEDDFAIAFKPRENFATINTFEFYNPLAFKKDSILVLEKNNE